MKFLPNTIVYFHEVHDQQRLVNTLELLIKNYRIIGLRELEDYYYSNKEIKNSCHITFDDGDISFYKNVFPIIKKYNIPVSLYVSPLMALEEKNFWFQEIKGYSVNELIKIINKVTNQSIENISSFEIKKHLKTLRIEVISEIIKRYQDDTNTIAKPPMNMNVNQLKEVKSTGLVDIGAHTLNHPILTNETDEIASNEIITSIDLLNDILNCDIRYFVYPNGNYGEREINILKNKGIKLAFTTERGKITNLNNPLSVPRNGAPFISMYNNKAYFLFKCFFQLLAGEERYYKYASTWGSVLSKLN